MAKCPNCGGELHPQENGLWKCAECGKLFRMKQKTPPESDMNAGAPQAQTPPASERNVTEPPVQTEPSAPADEAQTAEREELAVLRARIAAMEAKQAELERGATAKQRESGAGAAVLSFLKKWGFKVVLPVGLLLIALITLLVCFCGVRGIYVNIDDPNEFYSFDATNYEYHGIFMGEEYVDKGTWKKSGGQLELTYKDEDFGKVTESYDFSSLDSNNTIFISDDFGNKGEFKRVSLLSYGTSQKIKITLDGNGGSGGDSHKVQIGFKIQEPAEPARDGYMFMGWYTTPDGWKTGEGEQLFFENRVWEDATYYANWKNTTQFNLTGDGLDEPVKFTEGDNVESLYMSARGWNSLPDGVTGLIFKDASGNEIDPSSPPLDNVHVTVVYDVRIENGILQYVNPVLTEYTIPASVTEIASGAFDGCTELEAVYIASRSSALTIQDGAFDECEKLSLVAGYADSTAMGSVIKASGVTRAHITAGTIASSAFDGCTTLTSVTVGDGVTSIGNDAFNGCCAITSATMPSHAIDDIPRDNLKTIVITSGSIFIESFRGCTSLTSITIGNGVTSIEGGAFRGCTSLTSITIGNGVTRIGDSVFQECTSLTSVTIPDSVTSIGHEAFYACTSLTSVTIPDSVKSIGGSAFAYCTSLTSVTIPDSVTSIGGSAFSDCTGLTSITIPDSVTSIGEEAFYNCSSLTSVAIGNGVTSIADYAFENCTGLTSITIGNGVTSIGDAAFRDCTGLTSVTIPDSVTSIGSSAFAYCYSLTSITIPDSVTSIGEYAFYGCSGLTSVTISDSVTSIGERAFYSCRGLTSITIPDSVTSIGYFAFYRCSGLTSVTIGDGVTSIGEDAFSGCIKLVEVYNKSVLDIAAGSTEHGNVGYNAKNVYTKEGGSWFTDTADGFRFFYDGEQGYLMGYYGSKTAIDLPASFTAYDGALVESYAIYKYAFEGCADLTSITIPDSVTSIEYCAFYNCTALTSITIPNSVTSIGDGAFEGCSSLESITIPFVGATMDGTEDTHFGYIFGAPGDSSNDEYVPASLKEVIITGGTSIGWFAFYGCTGLTSITIPDSVTSIGWSAFSGCSSLTSVTIPDSVTSIDRYAFCDCSGLTSVTIGNSVMSIGKEAFYGCSGLTSIIIPNSVTSIGQNAFYRCSSLTSVKFEVTTGWYRASGIVETSGISLSSSDLSDPSTAAEWLTSTYCYYYWKRNV